MRFLPIIIVFKLSFLSLTWSQQQDKLGTIDSLLGLIEGETALNNNKVDWLNQLGYEYWIIDPNLSEQYGVQALEIARVLPYPKGVAFANRVIGVSHWARGNTDLAFKFLLEAENQYLALNDSLGVANSQLNMGMVYADQQNYNMAKIKYEQALVLFKKVNADSRIATTYTKIADLRFNQNQLEQAYQYLVEALEIHKKNDFQYGLAEANSKLGKIAMANSEYTEAIAYLLLAIESSKKRNDQVGLANHYHDIGFCFFQKEDLKVAEQYISLGKELAEQYQLKKTQKQIYWTLKELALKKGNYKKAIQYYDQYITVSDTLFNEEKSNLIAAMEATNAFKAKEQQLEMARQNVSLLQQQNRTKYLTILALIFGILAIGAIAWALVLNKNKSLLQKQQALKEAATKTQALQQTIRVKEQELTSYTFNFVQKNQLIQDLKQSFDSLKQDLNVGQQRKVEKISSRLNSVLRIDEDWNDFRKHFENAHPELIQQLNQKHPDLTKNEFKLIALIRLNLSSKEISSILGISPDSVKTARYRLRKKLGLNNQVDLFDFLLNYETSI